MRTASAGGYLARAATDRPDRQPGNLTVSLNDHSMKLIEITDERDPARLGYELHPNQIAVVGVNLDGGAVVDESNNTVITVPIHAPNHESDRHQAPPSMAETF